MDYEQKYKEALQKTRELIEIGKKKRWTIVSYEKDFEEIFPELAESEDEKIRKALLNLVHDTTCEELWDNYDVRKEKALAWLEKQGEQILANSEKTCKEIPNELEECEIKHGKYYYCIKDYYAGGNKRASKGDIIQALNGMSMMDLGVRANEYFMPINNIEQKTTLSEDDKGKLTWVINVWNRLRRGGDAQTTPSQMKTLEDWLKSLKDRIGGVGTSNSTT